MHLTLCMEINKSESRREFKSCLASVRLPKLSSRLHLISADSGQRCEIAKLTLAKLHFTRQASPRLSRQRTRPRISKTHISKTCISPGTRQCWHVVSGRNHNLDSKLGHYKIHNFFTVQEITQKISRHVVSRRNHNLNSKQDRTLQNSYFFSLCKRTQKISPWGLKMSNNGET